MCIVWKRLQFLTVIQTCSIRIFLIFVWFRYYNVNKNYVTLLHYVTYIKFKVKNCHRWSIAVNVVYGGLIGAWNFVMEWNSNIEKNCLQFSVMRVINITLRRRCLVFTLKSDHTCCWYLVNFWPYEICCIAWLIRWFSDKPIQRMQSFEVYRPYQTMCWSAYSSHCFLT